MRIWQNERGGTLVYVLFVFMVLMLIVPLVLTNTSNTTLRDLTDRNEKIAHNLVVSGMESFIAYLDDFSTGDRVDYFNQYPGFTSISYTLPEGIPVQYSMSKNSSNEVTITASAGSDSLIRTETIAYSFAVANPAASPYIADDGTREVVSVSPENVFYETGQAGTIPVPTTQLAGLKNEIAQAIDLAADGVNQTVQVYEAAAVTCSCTTESQIESAINNSTANPVILKMSGDITFNNNINLTWGSASKPVILIFNNLTFNNKAELNVYGTLIVKGTLTTHNKAELNMLQVNGGYGDFYTLGALVGNNTLDVNLPGTMFAGQMLFNNLSTVVSNKLIVENDFTVNNNTDIQVNTDILAGSVTVHNNSDITATSGDFFVEGNFTASNNIDIVSGGVVGVGGTLTIWGSNSTINTGGGTSSLITSGTSGTGGGGTSTVGWNPTRL